MKILLVDDSQTMRKLQKRTLRNIGYEDVIEADDGEQGLKLLEEHNIDLILLDINMPKMDGLETLKNIRKISSYDNIKIIMVTSESDKKILIESIGEGANDYLTKPFRPELLKDKIIKVQ